MNGVSNPIHQAIWCVIANFFTVGAVVIVCVVNTLGLPYLKPEIDCVGEHKKEQEGRYEPNGDDDAWHFCTINDATLEMVGWICTVDLTSNRL